MGVGQSETEVHNMVDAFVLVMPPAAGDELQVSAVSLSLWRCLEDPHHSQPL